MFKQLFAVLDLKLEEIMQVYPTAQGTKREILADQLEILQRMSNDCLETWLDFDEKLSVFQQMKDLADVTANQIWTDEHYMRGKGYFELAMIPEAIHEFKQVIQLYPDFMPSRYYLALCHLQNENFSEAHTLFQQLLTMTDDHKLRAVTYNALGCIHAANQQLTQACELFQLAHETDPSLHDPLHNLSACLMEEGTLYYGDVEGTD